VGGILPAPRDRPTALSAKPVDVDGERLPVVFITHQGTDQELAAPSRLSGDSRVGVGLFGPKSAPVVDVARYTPGLRRRAGNGKYYQAENQSHFNPIFRRVSLQGKPVTYWYT